MNGTIWKHEGQRGIEVGRTPEGQYLSISVINDNWPFPSEPVCWELKRCVREREPTDVWNERGEFDHVFVQNGEAPL